MKDCGTDILACTPSYALLIADTAIEMGYDPATEFKISGGIFGAEPASDNMREEIASKLGIQYMRRVRPLRDHGPRRGHGMRGTAPACTWPRTTSTARSWTPRRWQARARRRVGRARHHHAHPRVLPARALPHARRHPHHLGAVRVRAHAPQDRPAARPHRRHAHHPRRERVSLADRAGHHRLPGDRYALPDHPHHARPARPRGRCRWRRFPTSPSTRCARSRT